MRQIDRTGQMGVMIGCFRKRFDQRELIVPIDLLPKLISRNCCNHSFSYPLLLFQSVEKFPAPISAIVGELSQCSVSKGKLVVACD
jgi:hypothetical protein